jgi:hypothetical protein
MAGFTALQKAIIALRVKESALVKPISLETVVDVCCQNKIVFILDKV